MSLESTTKTPEIQFVRSQTHRRVNDLYRMWRSGDHSFIDQEQTLIGHIVGYRIAGGGKMLFIDFTDGTTIQDIKCMAVRVKPGKREDESPDSEEAYFDSLFEQSHRGTGVELHGPIVKSPEKATQPFEMQIKTYTIHGKVDEPDHYVLSCKQVVPRETMRTHYPHLREQSKVGMATSLISQEAYYQWTKSMRQCGMGQVPFVGYTQSDCEGGAEQFIVTRLLKPGIKVSEIPTKDDNETVDFSQDFFERPVYETCSGQLELEFSAMGVSGVFTNTRASRAEPSTGPFHLATFDMQEWEMVCRSLQEVMRVARSGIQGAIQGVLKNRMAELMYLTQLDPDNQVVKELPARLERYVCEDWPVVTHQEAVRRMLHDVEEGKVTFDETPSYDGDLTKQHERYITEQMFGCLPVFVCGYPAKIKSFYMPQLKISEESEDQTPRVNCFDLLFPYIGEVVGGSMREHDHDKLMAQIQERGMDPTHLKHYLDIRKNGSLPHGGAGIGWARLIIVLTGAQSAKDVVSMPRAKGCFV